MKILILYSVAGSAIAIVAGLAGLGIGAVMFASFVGLPILHVLYLIGRIKGYF